MKLYDHPLSGNCYKVKLLLAHLGLEYEKVNVDIFSGEHKKEEFKRLNPNQKIPVLDDEGFILWESNAILHYIGNKYSPNPYFSLDPERYGLISQWLLFGKTTIDPNLAVSRYYMKFLGKGNYDEDQLNRLHELGNAALETMNNHLAQNDFLAVDYSIADMGCYPYVKLSPEGGFDITGYSNVVKWCERVEAQPGYETM